MNIEYFICKNLDILAFKIGTYLYKFHCNYLFLLNNILWICLFIK